MLLISTYQDLLIEIDIYIKRLEDLQREQYALTRLRWNNGVGYDLFIEKQVELNNKVAIVQAIVDDKRETQKDILEKLKQLEGLEYQIAYKRFVEGKTLNEIADELNISEIWAKKKSAKVSRVYQEYTDMQD